MKVEHIYISESHNFTGHYGKPAGTSPVVEKESVECVAGRGIEGDRFFDFKDDFKGQITFFSQEVFEDLCQRFQVLDREPSCFRRNIIVSGADLPSLIGQDFEIGGIRFHGTQESAPCFWMNDAFHPGAEAAMKGNGGLRARILTSGTLQKGAVTIVAPA